MVFTDRLRLRLRLIFRLILRLIFRLITLLSLVFRAKSRTWLDLGVRRQAAGQRLLVSRVDILHLDIVAASKIIGNLMVLTV